MKTERISRLLEAFKAGQAQQIKSGPRGSTPTPTPTPTASQNNDAVQLSAGFGKSARPVEATATETKADRQDKIDRLKDQVRSGTYSTSTQEIATAVAKELTA